MYDEIWFCCFADDLYQLIIDDVKSSDIGTYVCRVTNDVGKSSCSANLYVDRAVTVPQFVGKDEPLPQLFEGDELRFVLFVIFCCVTFYYLGYDCY
jgi:hypothetical protein